MMMMRIDNEPALLKEIEHLKNDRRERIATAIMSGLCARSGAEALGDVCWCMRITDDLIAELDRDAGSPQ